MRASEPLAERGGIKPHSGGRQGPLAANVLGSGGLVPNAGQTSLNYFGLLQLGYNDCYHSIPARREPSLQPFAQSLNKKLNLIQVRMRRAAKLNKKNHSFSAGALCNVAD